MQRFMIHVKNNKRIDSHDKSISSSSSFSWETGCGCGGGGGWVDSVGGGGT